MYGFRGQIQLGLEWLQFTLTDLLTDASKPITLVDAVRATAPRPVLLIAAGGVPDEGHAAAYVFRIDLPYLVVVLDADGRGRSGKRPAPHRRDLWTYHGSSAVDPHLGGHARVENIIEAPFDLAREHSLVSL
jgi:hypothetical protein